jgi:hypothetical protein|tara:strand:+ start:3266 stop:3739 length:474 start_codon:yes stop_codon:yes gene_type:complete
LQVKKYIVFLILLCCSNNVSNSYIKDTASTNVIDSDVVLTEILESYKQFSDYPQTSLDAIWNYAHPDNKKITGPKENFRNMLLSEPYNSILDLKEYSFTKTVETENSEHYEIKILAKNNSYFEVTWVFQFDECPENPQNKCWLTIAVTAPSYYESGV